MDSLLALLVILAITAASNWLQKRAQGRQTGGDENETAPPPLPPTPIRQTDRPSSPTQPAPQPSPRMDWEKELRRLLQGETPTAPPPPVLVVRKEPPAPSAPPPIPTFAPRRPVSVPASAAEPEGPESSRLTKSVAAYQKAQKLHEAAAGRLHHVVEQTKHHTSKQSVKSLARVSTEVASALSLLRNPNSARQALVASLVFGPPKGLED